MREEADFETPGVDMLVLVGCVRVMVAGLGRLVEVCVEVVVVGAWV